jgi:hypothetical protein
VTVEEEIKMRRIMYVVVITFVMAFSYSTSVADHVTINYRVNDVASVKSDGAETGNLDVFGLTIPQEVIGKRIDAVIVEFYLDADHTLETTRTEYVPVCVSPVLMRPEPTTTVARDLNTAVTVPVHVGGGQRATADITSLVRDWIAKSETNHDLTIGLTDEAAKTSSISMRSDGYGDDTVVRVTYYYSDRLGGRAPR